jgi:hypothetical protein
MKFGSVVFFLIIFAGCGSNETPAVNSETIVAEQKQEENYFPVTTYIRGQLNDIKHSAVNPLRIVTRNNHVDSTWLKIESIDTIFNVFLTPVIDTANLKPFFSESKFLDNSVGSYTWTYEPKKTLPDTLSLQRWTVYVDPNTQRVSSIFMVKGLQDKSQLQLYWLADSAGKIVQIRDSAGTAVIEKETLIKWDFDE